MAWRAKTPETDTPGVPYALRPPGVRTTYAKLKKLNGSPGCSSDRVLRHHSGYTCIILDTTEQFKRTVALRAGYLSVRTVG